MTPSEPGSRTWTSTLRDSGYQLYGSMAFALEGIGGRGFGGFSDPEEDWRSTPGIVEFSREVASQAQALSHPSDQ